MLSGPEEAQLARAAATGDGDAFAGLYDAYEQRIHTYCRRLLGTEHDADDATQEAFLKVLRRLPELDLQELDFGAYLFTTARNCCYEMIRKRKRIEPVDETPEDGEGAIGAAAALGSDPAAAAMLADQRRSVRAANARLPTRQREVLVLREVEQMGYEQIASVMAMNTNSVAQLLSRARVRLRQELRGEEAGAIVATSPSCRKAQPLLARRLDGDLAEGEEATWLEDHLAECAGCRLAAEAMEEAGRSYRGWAPILPAAYLFRDTIAKASELTGNDWSAVERRSPRQEEGGSGEGDPGNPGGNGGGPAGTSGSGYLPGTGMATRAAIGAGTLTLVLGLFLVFGARSSDEESGVAIGDREPAVTAGAGNQAAAERLRARKANRLQARRAARRRAAAASENGAVPGAEAAPAPASATQPVSTPVSGTGGAPGAGTGGEGSGESPGPSPGSGPTARPPVLPGTPPVPPGPNPPGPTTPPESETEPCPPPDLPEPSEPDDPPSDGADPPPTDGSDDRPSDDAGDESTDPDAGPPAEEVDGEERIDGVDGTS